MIKLVNGRGQLGTHLGWHTQGFAEYREIDATIYHTWNFMKKSDETQTKCLEIFADYVDQHQDENLFFTSTSCEDKNPYVAAKRLAEGYLLKNHRKGCVIRLPNLIGKGICDRFRKGEAEPYSGDTLELMSVDNAVKEILGLVTSVTNGDFTDKTYTLNGEIVSTELAYNLLRFGNDGVCSGR